MRRKLVKQGPSTLTVSLPSEWVKTNQLKAGNDVVLTIEQNNCIISTDAVNEHISGITIDVRHYSNEFIGVLLHALHKKGYEEVRIQAAKNQLTYIENRISKNLLGYEIVNHLGETLVVRFITKIDAEELDVLIRRAFLVTIALAEGVLAAPQNAKELLVLEETNNRITNYCERILVKNSHKEEHAVFRYLIVWLLEKIADEYKNLIRAEGLNSVDSEITLQLLKQFYDLYYKYSLERHDEFLQELTRRIGEMQRKNSLYVPILVTVGQANGSLIALRAE